MHGFAPLLASADLFAVVGLPWQEAYRQADRLFWRETLFTVLAFALAALAALFSADLWIRRPLTGLQEAVGRMTQGDLSVRAKAGRGSSPELRELAENFNEMASTLERRQTALEASESRFRAVVETAADGIITINARGIIASVNSEAERLFGYARDELVGRNVKLLMPSPDAERHDEYLARYLRTGEAKIIGIGREVTGRREDGSTFAMSLSIGEFRLEGERYFTGIVRDVTERKRAEDRQRLLSAEVDHRAKNLLAMIQAMILLTKGDASSVDDFAKTIIGRLHALSRAHDLLAREKWTGASLRAIITNEAQAFGADGARLSVVGDDAYLPPRAAQTLSLALHELTTNAAKHGALSMPQGQVEIRSTVSGPELRLIWTETGGPEVKPPCSHGFGTVIVERSIAHELGGGGRGSVRPGRAALRDANSPEPRVAAVATDVRGHGAMKPAAILIVQHDFLAAERLRLLLGQAGYEIVGVAGETRGAARFADQHHPDLAIVDMMLEIDVDGVRTATELVRRHAMKILITTGFPDSVIEAAGVADLACAIVRKPYTDDELLAGVARCLADGRQPDPRAAAS
jgi:PAS domain S-box-containing protein